MKFPRPTKSAWKTQSLAIFWSFSLYIAMEWLFFASKPSFLSSLSAWESQNVLWSALFCLQTIGILTMLLAWMLSLIWKNDYYRTILLAAVTMVSTLAIGITISLIIDRVLYTRFGVGILHSADRGRWIGSLVFVGLLVGIWMWLSSLQARMAKPPGKTAWIVTAVVFASAFAVTLSGSSILRTWHPRNNPTGKQGVLRDPPNILLIASDGLNANRMSLYGYKRDTTPFISRMANQMGLICENAFTNAGNSGGSVVSMLTGKLPTETGLIYPPDILRGEDAYQHLPGILRKNGYRSIDISIRHYVDPYDLNMRNSYDEANFRRVPLKRWPPILSAALGMDTLYFLAKTWEQISNRWSRIRYGTVIPNPFDEVSGTGKGRALEQTGIVTDRRVNAFLSFIDESPEPFFAHLHLLMTHGPQFRFDEAKFSKGKQQDRYWMTDFYDDAVLYFDSVFNDIVKELQNRKLLEKTVIVLNTDHGIGFNTHVRLPLIFFFPGGAHKGRISENVQSLDIAATVLDYIGIPKPEWMGGVSLISDRPDPKRPIFSFTSIIPKVDEKGWFSVQESTYSPPFYQLGKVSVVVCNRWFEADLTHLRLQSGWVELHSAPCPPDELPSDTDLLNLITNHLSQNGYVFENVVSNQPSKKD